MQYQRNKNASAEWFPGPNGRCCVSDPVFYLKCPRVDTVVPAVLNAGTSGDGNRKTAARVVSAVPLLRLFSAYVEFIDSHRAGQRSYSGERALEMTVRIEPGLASFCLCFW